MGIVGQPAAIFRTHVFFYNAACWREGQPAPYIHLVRTFASVEGEKGKIKAMSMLCNMFRRLPTLFVSRSLC